MADVIHLSRHTGSVQSSHGTLECSVCGRPTVINPRSVRRHLCERCDETVIRLSPHVTPGPVDENDLFSVTVENGTVRVLAPWPLTTGDAVRLAAEIVLAVVGDGESR